MPVQIVVGMARRWSRRQRRLIRQSRLRGHVVRFSWQIHLIVEAIRHYFRVRHLTDDERIEINRTDMTVNIPWERRWEEVW